MIEKTTSDVIIIGGGLAGLTLAISLVKTGRKIAIIEKETYPFHKVCGEYISMESWDFLNRCGVVLEELRLPIIKKLQITAANGKALAAALPLGGFGVSRFTLDNRLKEIALQKGVQILENTKVTGVDFKSEYFDVFAGTEKFSAAVVCGSFGKRSNLDVKWKRPFVNAAKNKLNNYIGIKYHIQYDGLKDEIALHNFHDGYCGISQIEESKFCLCYLTTAANLKKSNNDIEFMEQNILSKNPHLAKIFAGCTKLYSLPLSISQVSFQQKTQIHNHILLIGDAAGMIVPLCGNGMSMAMHGSFIASKLIEQFLSGELSRAELENSYQKKWKQQFASRLQRGRMIQRFFGKAFSSNLLIPVLKKFPGLVQKIIKQTHGKPF